MKITRFLGSRPCCWPSKPPSRAEPPAQKLLPKDTVMVVAVPDTGKALEVLTNSAMGRMWRDPAVKAFKDKFHAKLQAAAVAPLERQLGIHFADYQGLARGQMTFALVPVDHPAKPDETITPPFFCSTPGTMPRNWPPT